MPCCAQDGKLKGYGKAGVGSRQKREVTFDNGAVYNGEWLVSCPEIAVFLCLRPANVYGRGRSSSSAPTVFFSFLLHCRDLCRGPECGVCVPGPETFHRIFCPNWILFAVRFMSICTLSSPVVGCRGVFDLSSDLSRSSTLPEKFKLD